MEHILFAIIPRSDNIKRLRPSAILERTLIHWICEWWNWDPLGKTLTHCISTTTPSVCQSSPQQACVLSRYRISSFLRYHRLRDSHLIPILYLDPALIT